MQTRRFILIILIFLTQCQTNEGIRENPYPDKQEKIIKEGIGNRQLRKKDEIGMKSNPSGNKIKRRNFCADTTVKSNPRTNEPIDRINYLRENKITPDLNEPVSRKFLSDHTDSIPFESMIELSQESFLNINFDNDILNYTDRFYTNGIRIDLIIPGLQMNPLSKLMVPYWRPGKNYYGLSVVQNMYTPSTTKLGGILYGDRPYSAYLYLGSFKISNDRVNRYRQTSELDLGIIGPNSYGEWVQRSFHNAVPTNNEPLGWEYQIQNDLVLNYSFLIEKGVLSKKSLELILSAKGNLGTLYTNLNGGIQFRTGQMNPYFSSFGVSKKKESVRLGLKNFLIYFFAKVNGQIVGYDATLEGGLLNKSSIYTISSSDVKWLVFNGSAGLHLSYNGIGIDLEQFILSPEFTNGPWHKWVHIALRFAL